MLCAFRRIGGRVSIVAVLVAGGVVPLEAALAQDFAPDRLIARLSERPPEEPDFASRILDAVVAHPQVRSALAQSAQVGLDRRIERAARLPELNAELSGAAVIVREFEDDFDNIVERSRPNEQANLSVIGRQQLFDFGAASKRTRGAAHRHDQSRAEARGVATEIALAGAQAYLDVLRHSVLAELAQDNIRRHDQILTQIRDRQASGAGVLGEVARAEARRADAQARAAGIARDRALAASQFEELFGDRPGGLYRPSALFDETFELDRLLEVGLAKSGEIAAARARERASRSEYEAEKASRYPNVALELRGTKFDLQEANEEFEITGRLVVNYSLYQGGALAAQQSQSFQRLRQSQFAEEAARRQVRRTIAQAYDRLRAAEATVPVLRSAALANARSRDAYAERYAVTGGALFDLLQVERDYFESAQAYVNAVFEEDLARYAVAARTGELLEALGIFLFTDRNS